MPPDPTQEPLILRALGGIFRTGGLFCLALALGCWIGGLGGSTPWRTGAGGDRRSAAGISTTNVLEIDWSADGKTLLSRSRGELGYGTPLLLHSLGTDGLPLAAPGDGSAHLAALLPDAGSALIYQALRGIWRVDLSTGDWTHLMELPTGTDATALRAAPDGQTAALGVNLEVILFDPSDGRVLQRLTGHTGIALDLAFSPDSQRIGMAARDGTVRIWSLTGNLLHTLVGHSDAVKRVGFLPDARGMLSIGFDGCMILWNVDAGTPLWKASLESIRLEALGISPDGKMAAIGGYEGQIQLWDLQKQTRLKSLTGHIGSVRALQFSPDGQTLASAGDDGTLHFWNVSSGSAVRVLDVSRRPDDQ